MLHDAEVKIHCDFHEPDTLTTEETCGGLYIEINTTEADTSVKLTAATAAKLRDRLDRFINNPTTEHTP